jgi:branched-chain amino acid transport system ATP-binding protein
MSGPVLEVKNIQTYIGQFHILEGVSLSLKPDSILAVLGRNGAGKTTTLRSIMGLTPIREGEILFEGRPIHRLRPLRWRNWGLAMCRNTEPSSKI